MLTNNPNPENTKNIEEKSEENEKAEKLAELQKEEDEKLAHLSGTFDINFRDIEKLMGLYKERDSNLRDLAKIKELGGSEGIISKLKTDGKKGISSDENRENDFGSNQVFIEPVPPFCSYVCDALGDLMVRILIIAAVVQIALGATLGEEPEKDWVDGLSIIIAILVVTLVGSITNYQKETKFHELNAVQNEGTKYKVIRNGVPKEMKSDDILVGDLINIMIGDILPADMILIEGNGIKMDESSLTGESDSLRKEPFEKCIEMQHDNNSSKIPSPLMLSGTHCVEGTGLAIVLAVGDHSQKGIIRRTVDNAQENSQTPLEEKLESIAENIGWFGMGAGIVTLVALTIRFGISYDNHDKTYKKESYKKDLVTAYLMNFPYERINKEIYSEANIKLNDPKSEISENILNIIMLSVSIIVVAIPEGLPLAVTLSLAFSIKKLMDYKNLVRKMHACETMGGANYICTDKTGTLTKNEMNVYKVLTAKNKITLKETLEANETGALDKNKNNDQKIREGYEIYFKNKKFWEQLKISISLNVDGQIKHLEKPDINGDTESCETKNKTDKAFIDFLYRFRVSISGERTKYISDKNYYKQIPFDSKRKRMTTFIKSKDFPTGYRLFSKGGGENARVFCNYFLDPDTSAKKPLDDSISMKIKQSIEEFNKDKLRSLYIAYKDITKEEYENCEKPQKNNKLIDEYDLIFLAVFGIKDSLRDGVKEAVRKCHEASVNVIMVTGDNIVTATAIAKDCGILGADVDLKNLGPNDIEEDPEAMNDPSKKQNYINNLIENQPKALTGNSFYNAVGGLICEICQLDTNLCKCPKTESEAEQMAKKNQQPKKKVKKDVIKDIESFKKITEKLRVMARSQPLHKYALVLGLKYLKNVVAVTGDGTNDAPALSKSDVGFAMFAGTDIAKEASDIVIIDNNFSSIVTAIIYGRNIYDNIRKFLQFQLSVNFCACILVFVCACVGNETPLTPIQMLWVNLIMDSLGSLALATEPPYEELLQREPTKRNESIINGRMWKHIIIQSLCQIILLVILYFLAPEFVKEDNLVRLAENKVLNFCYSEFPGKDVNHIVYGTDVKWSRDGRLVHAHKLYCGKYTNRQNLKDAYTEYVNANCATVHMSMIFNIFVFYTLFNQINCRVIDDSFNILVRITKSFLFPLICICEIGLQVAIIYVGKSPFHIINDGFTGVQWGICIGFSAITFVVSFLVKFLPIHSLIDKWTGQTKEENVEEGEEKNENNDNIKDKNKEDNLSNGAEKNILKKEDDWNSERNLNEVIYKKDA